MAETWALWARGVWLGRDRCVGRVWLSVVVGKSLVDFESVRGAGGAADGLLRAGISCGVAGGVVVAW